MQISVVQLFGAGGRPEQKEAFLPKPEVKRNDTNNVVELIPNKKIAHGVPASPVYRQLEALLVTQGVDMQDAKIASDYKIITFLVQGILDRMEGNASDRCLLLDTLRHALAYEVMSDTDEVFGDLLGRLDQHG